jgi:hypothetical protein
VGWGTTIVVECIFLSTGVQCVVKLDAVVCLFYLCYIGR